MSDDRAAALESLTERWADSPLRRAAARFREKALGATDGAILLATAAVLDQVADAWDEDVIWDRPETDEYRPSYPAAWWCGFCLAAIRSADYTDEGACTCPRWALALDLAAEVLGEDLAELPGPYSEMDDDVPAEHRVALDSPAGAA
jgi:hypothetical protein